MKQFFKEADRTLDPRVLGPFLDKEKSSNMPNFILINKV